MHSQGRFYCSMVNQPGPSIVRVSADGAACDEAPSADVPTPARASAQVRERGGPMKA